MVAAAALALVLGSALPEKPEGAEVEWTVSNGDATFVAKQTARGDGCHVAVTHDADDAVLWQKDVCLGGKSDRKLLSADGTRLMVFAALPTDEGKGGSAWRSVTVVWLFDQGNLVESAVAGQLVEDGSEVRRRLAHFQWLQGVGGVPGVPPRLSDDGKKAVVDGIDGKHSELPFRGLGLPPLKPEKTKKKHY